MRAGSPNDVSDAPRITDRRRSFDGRRGLSESMSQVSVIALVSAYNEADIIAQVVDDLVSQQISVYLLDDGSTEDTIARVEPFVGPGHRHRPVLHRHSGAPLHGSQSCGKSELQQLEADWFIHHDADEFRESPWPGVSLREGIQFVHDAGYNAIDFVCLEFQGDVDTASPSQDVSGVPLLRRGLRTIACRFAAGGAPITWIWRRVADTTPRSLTPQCRSGSFFATTRSAAAHTSSARYATSATTSNASARGGTSPRRSRATVPKANALYRPEECDSTSCCVTSLSRSLKPRLRPRNQRRRSTPGSRHSDANWRPVRRTRAPRPPMSTPLAVSANACRQSLTSVGS